MKARLTWNDKEMTWRERPMPDKGEMPSRSRRSGLRVLEWVFLIVGLLAIDCFVWVNTSSVLYQAYEDWAFDQTLRGLTPDVGRIHQRRSALVVR